MKDQLAFSRREISTRISSFSLSERLRFLWNEKVKIVDLNRMPDLLAALDTNGFGFIRGQVPVRYRFLDRNTGKEYPYSRMVMLHASKADANSQIKIAMVPGLHVVTGSEGHQDTQDPFYQFLHIFEHQFHGGSEVNTYLLSPNYMNMLMTHGYEGNQKTGRVVRSQIDAVEGDQYKLLIWTGFTNNYLCSSDTDTRTNPYGNGGVKHAPLSQIEPFVFLAPRANTAQRCVFYSKSLQRFALPNPLRVFDASGKEIFLSGEPS